MESGMARSHPVPGKALHQPRTPLHLLHEMHGLLNA